MLPKILFGLDVLLGSRFAAVTATGEGLVIRSTNLGVVVLFGLAGLALAGILVAEMIRHGLTARRGHMARTSLGVVVTCVAVMSGLTFGATEARVSPERIVVEVRTVLGVSAEEMAVSEVTQLGVASARIKAATRNGSPVGPDRTGYGLRVVGRDGRRLRLTPVAAGRLDDVSSAVRTVQGYLETATGRPVRTNLHRYAGDGE
ncbi:hypothetical protein [Sagittula salina]|uniref:Uncharacterized protein n=1 Tax=Sagittula salina TaxID=2820268 RepID=A0A940MTP8_9RHOB|nr:hypothetical protein [Sagittula salina]MBP0483792.1 hypothetical protein [Sagittula salina]